ncbi:MAG: hypothetical protein IAF94_14535 [Pirellulaceae bacterium]|nr:hypothetical protein [Pirellulaceae bacterium]
MISPNPITGAGTLLVVDGGLNDADGLVNGALQVNITETVAPLSYAIDDDPTRSVTFRDDDLRTCSNTSSLDKELRSWQPLLSY